MRRRITIEPLTTEAFAPFGEVLTPPPSPGRAYFDAALRNDRPGVAASLSLSRVDAAHAGPLTAMRMERHQHSSQSFVPLGDAPFVVLVCPPGGDAPDMTAARAFIAADGVGVTYGAGVWHHPLTVLRAPASFAVFMWRDGGPDDEEFVDIAPTEIVLQPAAPETAS
jgi:ureidoglycolate lyase